MRINERSTAVGTRLAEDKLRHVDATTKTEWVAGVQENINRKKHGSSQGQSTFIVCKCIKH